MVKEAHIVKPEEKINPDDYIFVQLPVRKVAEMLHKARHEKATIITLRVRKGPIIALDQKHDALPPMQQQS